MRPSDRLETSTLLTMEIVGAPKGRDDFSFAALETSKRELDKMSFPDGYRVELIERG